MLFRETVCLTMRLPPALNRLMHCGPCEWVGYFGSYAYEWFYGFAEDGIPRWTTDMAARSAVFADPNGIKIVSVCLAPAIDRYLLIYNPRDNAGHLGLFEAAEPWGPWKRIAYLRSQPLFMPP